MIESKEEIKQSNLILKKQAKFTPSRPLQRKLQTEKWVLDMGKYHQQNCKQMFECAQQVKVVRMWIGFNDSPQILHDISQTKFTNLVQLWLTQNYIESIEIISNIYMPQMEDIHLRQNHIINIKPLRKCNWPNIQVLSIYGNKCPDLSSLSQMNASKLHTLWTEYQKKDRIQSEDMGWMVKLQSKKLQSICAASKHRIKQLKFINRLKKKQELTEEKLENPITFHFYEP